MKPFLIIIGIIGLCIGLLIYEIHKESQTPEEKARKEMEKIETDLELKKAADEMIKNSYFDTTSFQKNNSEEIEESYK